MKVLALVGLMAAGVFASQVAAQNGGFDPRAPCGKILRQAGDMDKMMVAAWGLGYRAAQQGDTPPLDMDNIRTILRDMIGDCTRNEQASILALMQTGGARKALPAGSSGDAERLLRRFFAPGEDLVALTASLAPNAADIAAVYGEPLASRLGAMYAQMFTPGARIGPKPEQNDLLLWYASTAALKRGDPVLGDFPGGYAKVRPYFIGDQPIVRFKFVQAGETLGLAFDGLVFVNGRWILMPKPWRALE